MNVDVTLVAVTLLMIGNVVKTQDVTVTFDADPVENIIEGVQVLLKCHVSGSFNVERDSLLILKTSGVPTKLASDDGREPSAPDNIMFVGWVPRDGGHFLYLNIFNISRADRGDYACKAVRPQGDNKFEILAYKTLTVDVLYPPSGLPTCDASPSNADLTYYDGDKVTLRCTSDSGNPAVPIEWLRTGNVTSIPEAQIQTVNDSIVATLMLTLDTDFDGITFGCIRKTDSNTTKPQSCFLGPLTVLKSPGKQMTGVIVAIVVVIITAILIITIYCILIRSGKCKWPLQLDRPMIKADNILPTATLGNGKVAAEVNSDNNPANAKNSLSPNEGERYGVVVQKDKLRSKTSSPANNNKLYPDPPSYPRPPKIRESIEEEQYAQTGISLKKTNGKSELSPYANTLDVGPTLSPVSKEPTVQLKLDDDTNTSDTTVNGVLHSPAPTEAPPPPPQESS